MRLDEYTSYDAVGLAGLVAKGEVAPKQLAVCALDACEAVNPQINAVVEAFHARVASMDEPILEGPFAGVPTMLKDLFHGEVGTACGNGSRLSDGYVAGHEAEFTARIRRSGLINVGRTTTSEFGIMGTTETLAAGRTGTPWGGLHMAGGSSGGAAAVVAAGIVPMAAASDGGGSIRIPAASCGVVGLKPSRGRVTWGPHISEALVGWATHFMITRSVRDTAVALDALAGPAVGDPFMIPGPVRPFGLEIGAPVERLRIGFWSAPWSGKDSDPEVVAATERTASLLAMMGHDVEMATPQFAWEPFLRAMTDVWAADNAHTIDSFAPAVGRVPGPDNLEGSTWAALQYGRTVTAGRLIDAFDTVNGISREMGRFFSEYDLLLTPTLGTLPAPLGVYDPTAPTELSEIFDSWSRLESFLPVFNATGQPAISLPLHTSESGLPIGMQLVGAFGTESLLLRVASALEEAAPWWDRIPPIHASRY